MKAAVSRSFGPPDVVTVTDVPRPEPRDDEILVRVRPSTSACLSTAPWRRSLLI